MMTVKTPPPPPERFAQPCGVCGSMSLHRDRCGQAQTFQTRFTERPWTTNSERKGNRWDRAEDVKRWREGHAWIARSLRLPPLLWASVTAIPTLRGPMQDVGACHPAVKAAIDGLVDAGVLPDDTPEYLTKITHLPGYRGPNSLTLIITGPAILKENHA